MKRIAALIVTFLLLTGCTTDTSSSVSSSQTSSSSASYAPVSSDTSSDILSTPSMSSMASGVDTSSSPAKIVEGQKSLVGYGNVTLNEKIYSVEVMQTKYLKPLTPDDKNFQINYSAVYGDFDLIVMDANGNECDKISLNQYFKNRAMGYPGIFKINFLIDTKNNKGIFGIYGPADERVKKSGEMPYAMFCLDKAGKLTHLTVDTEYFYTLTMTDFSKTFSQNDTTEHIGVTIGRTEGGGYISAEYIWNGNQYVLTPKS